MMPIATLQIQPVIRQMLAERKWIEGLGRLERKDFMLHDREHWPQINLPGNAPQQQSMYGNPMMQQQQQQMNQQRFPQYAYAHGQGPPTKRPRHSGPSGMPGSVDGAHDTSIEDEENTSLGDFFDHLSPREISMARYMQHHQWMEEVFSSPYASAQIVPPDLGLGLMGELKGLTEGIVEPPSAEEIGKALERPNQAKEAQPFTNLKKEQVDEFSRRVEKHLEEGRAEIERMKRQHAEKMAEWKKTKTLMQAEKRLRNATWEGHENAVPVFRLEVPTTNGHADESTSTDTVEDVVKNVENALGVKIQSHKESTMVEKGGLDEEQQRDDSSQPDEMDMKEDMSAMQQQEPMMSGANKVEDELQQSYGQPSQPQQATESAMSADVSSTPAEMPEPSFDLGEPGDLRDAGIVNEAGDALDQSALEDMVDMGDTSLMDGMDMDVDAGDIDFINDEQTPGDDLTAESMLANEGAELSAPQDAQAVETGVDEASAAPQLEEPQAASPVTLGETGEQEVPAPDQPLAATTTAPETSTLDTSTAIPPTSAPADFGEAEPGLESAAEPTAMPAAPEVPHGADIALVESGVDSTLFDDGTFDDLANMDGEAGLGETGDEDDLLDFDGGMGLEDSALGDAMYGMDTHTPMGGEGAEEG